MAPHAPNRPNLSVTLRMQDYAVTGHYRGGPYIDLHLGANYSSVPFAVINVWDYRAGVALISQDRAGVAGAMRGYRADLWPWEILAYAENEALARGVRLTA